MVRRRVAWRIIRANALAAAFAFVAIELTSPAVDTPDGPVSLAERVVFAAFNGVLGAAVVGGVSLLVNRRRDLELNRWLDESRPPTAEERERLLAEPQHTATVVLGGWLLGALLLGLNAYFRDGLGRTVVGAVTVMVLSALTASALSYFVEDRATRAEKVLSLGGAPPETPALGVRRTILVAWALGSGLPLAWIALVPQFRHPDADVSVAALTTVVAVIGLVSGAATAYFTASSVADPVERLRRAMRDVAAGDLDVTVPVDDADELGLLQAGFNHMVRAVAERQRLHELFGRHVGEDVARHALERGVELGGEEREVSVLFVDIVGSSALTSSLDPRDVVGVLNRFFAVVVGAAMAEDGWVNKFEGDGALCVFGAPAGEPDHAARALRAACAIRSQLVDVDAGIGVSTGSVVAGNVGTEARSEYTVIGTPVIEAARLVEQAKRHPSRVLAAASTVRAAGVERCGWTCVGPLELRGLGEVTAWSPSSTVTLANEITLSAAARGDATGPALLLLPGPTDSWRSYELVLDHLPTSVRAVAVSLRGHGDSDKPATGYRVEDLASDVVPLLDALGIERAVVAGHSGSCLVARRVAIDHPDRVAGLVLEASPTTLRGDAGLESFVASMVASLTDPIDPDFARSVITDTSTDGLAQEVVDRMVDEVLKAPARVWRELFADLCVYDDLDELHRISAPTLLVWGDADGLVGREMQATLTQRIPTAELLVYSGVGHTPRWEDPRRFADDVAAFVTASPTTTDRKRR